MSGLSFDELSRIIDNPDFRLDQIVCALRLPKLGMHEVRAVELTTAFELLDDIEAKTATHLAGLNVEGLKRQIADVQASGLLAILRVEADDLRYRVWVEAIEIRPVAEA